MSDLIDRQAAIDAADMADYPGLSIEDVDKVTGEVVKALKELPSAQPEIITCKDCAKSSKCYGDVVMRSRSGGNIYCPLTYCSEAERKGEQP